MSSLGYKTPKYQAIEYILKFCKEEGFYTTRDTLLEEFKKCEDYDEDINNNYHKIPSTALQDAIIRDITRKKSEETKECREQENLIDLILKPPNESTIPITKILKRFTLDTVVNPIAIAQHPQYPDIIAISYANNSIRIYTLSTMNVQLSIDESIPSIALSLAWRPKPTTELLVGCINGTVIVFNITDIYETTTDTIDTNNKKRGNYQVLQSWKPHTRYVINSIWTHTGDGFITGSHDCTICLFKVTKQFESPEDNIQLQKVEQPFTLVKKIQFKSQVECICLYNNEDEQNPEDISENKTNITKDAFICGIRDDYNLYIISQDEERIIDTLSMNEKNDTYVSFVPLHLSCSKKKQLLLVSTDHHTVICFHIPSKSKIATYYGCNNDGYSTPKVTWGETVSYETPYIYVTTQNNTIYIWDTYYRKNIGILNGHTKPIKSLIYNSAINQMITISFDRTLVVWGAED